jgi:ring-1,2-phenylacetyl-CoA epoxidase subunit PaaC
VTSAAAYGPLAAPEYVLRLADTSLILGQQLTGWIGHSPALEEDLGLANIALDLVGQARLLLTYAAELEGRGRSEDDLAFLRDPAEFRCAQLVQQPNGDFADTLVRQFLFDAWQIELYAGLTASRDERLAQIAAKALKEIRYHLRFSAGWVVRLGDGTSESHERAQRALNELWPFTNELCTADALDLEMLENGVAPDLAHLQRAWSARVDEVLTEATLARPAAQSYRWFGKRGEHGEHLGYVLADMQFLQRSFPGATW